MKIATHGFVAFMGGKMCFEIRTSKNLCCAKHFRIEKIKGV